jgi:hypothetical protein
MNAVETFQYTPTDPKTGRACERDADGRRINEAAWSRWERVERAYLIARLGWAPEGANRYAATTEEMIQTLKARGGIDPARRPPRV